MLFLTLSVFINIIIMKESDMMNPNNFYRPNMNRPINNGDRFIGGPFLAPFLLGGITGGLLAPAFYPRPIYQPMPIYRPYPVYPAPYYQNNYHYINY